MKKLSVFLLLLASASIYAAPSVERVVVRQQWPWSTDVKVEYSLVGVDENNPVDISVSVFNGDVDLTSAKLNDAITGDRYYITEPVGSFTIDPITAFGTEKVALGNFKVKLTLAPSPANMNEILYKVVDLDSPYTVTDVRRHDFYNGKMGEYVTSYQAIDQEFSTSLEDVLIWTGVTKDDVYKTDKMVFRRIPAAGKSFMMQTNNASVNGGAGVKVSFAKDYYISVFEMTQMQVKKFYPKWIPNETNALYAAKRAASCAKVAGNNTPLRSGDNDNNIPWPENTDHTLSQDTACLCGNMQKKIGLCFDLPTEAMWEYSCRAGTDSRLYTGDYSKKFVYNDTHVKKILRAVSVNNKQTDTSTASRNCDLTVGPNEPGKYKPNAFGLYDMLGNLWEWCIDRYMSDENLKGGSDPLGPTAEESSNTTRHVLRGGSYKWNVSYSDDRHNRPYSYGTEDHGIRLCIWLTYNEDGTLQK